MIKVYISLTCEIHINLNISREFFKSKIAFSYGVDSSQMWQHVR